MRTGANKNGRYAHEIFESLHFITVLLSSQRVDWQSGLHSGICESGEL